MTFRDLLTAFAAAVEANDGEGLASLFTEDGTYEDGFFGAHTGRPAIAAMLQRFHGAISPSRKRKQLMPSKKTGRPATPGSIEA